MATSSRTMLYNALYSFMTSPTPDAAALTQKVDQMTDAIDNYIIDVVSKMTTTSPAIVAAGIPVATAGSPTAQTGATTGPGQATITTGGLTTN